MAEFTTYFTLPTEEHFADGQTEYTAADIGHLDRVVSSQLSGALKVPGVGVLRRKIGANAAANSLLVTSGAGLSVNIAPGAGLFEDATYGPCYFELLSSLNVTPLAASSTLYLLAVFETTVGANSHEYGVAAFVVSSVPATAGQMQLATIVTGASTVSSVTDNRSFLRINTAYSNAATYASGTTYNTNDVATDPANGLKYVSKIDANTGHTPNSSPTQWEIFTPLATTTQAGLSKLLRSGLEQAIVTATATIAPTLTAAQWVHRVNSASGTTQTLPDATLAANQGVTVIVKNISTGTVTMGSTSSQTIDGAAPGGKTISSQWGVLRFYSNGTNWETC